MKSQVHPIWMSRGRHIIRGSSSPGSMTRVLAFLFITTFLLSSMPSSPISDIVMEAAEGSQDAISPISISYNSGLSTHPSVRSGNGTSKNPYVISDYYIDCTSSGSIGISIQYTTAFLRIRNITIDAHTDYSAIYLRSSSWNAQNIILDNITINGGGTHLYLYIPVKVTVTRCLFNNPSGTGDIIYAYYGTEDFITNNTFDCPGMDIDIDYASSFNILRNKGVIRRYEHQRWRYSNFANNTFQADSIRLYSGYFSDLQGNLLNGTDRGDDVVHIIDCNRIKIANNTINHGNDGIFVSHPNSYSPVRTNYPTWASLRFDDNLINGSSLNGIRFYYANGHPAMTYFRVYNNTFSNCGEFGISVRGGGNPTSVIWHNKFFGNNGAGSTYSTNNIQAEDYWAQMTWNTGRIGNHWSDLTSPDDNSDGIVDDTPYDLRTVSGAKDNLPVTNPLFDLESPYLKVLSPTVTYPDNSYINLTWEARDSISGIDKMEVKFGYRPWTDITGCNSYGIFAEKGDYWLKVKATDGSRLFTQVDIRIILNSTIKPFTIESPGDGEFFDSTSVPAAWNLIDGFIPRYLDISVDEGVVQTEDPFQPFLIETDEGNHDVLFTFEDHYGNRIEEQIEFSVDITDPEIDILYPSPGSVISNDLVYFQWDASDNLGVDKIIATLDQGIPMERGGNGFNEHLDKGPHTLHVEVFDKAGNSEEDSLAFVVSENTSLSILSPILAAPTRTSEFTVSWEYLVANLNIAKVEIEIDNDDPIEIDPASTSHIITLIQEGEHTIKVNAEDPAGNTVSDMVRITIDRTNPIPEITSHKNGQYLKDGNIGLEWSVIERYGIDHFELYINGRIIETDISEGRYNLQLDEGVHDISVHTYDEAGNWGKTNITLIVDKENPDLQLLSPSVPIITAAYLEIEWSGEDDNGISHYNLSFDGKVYEMGLNTMREVPVTEGDHVIIIDCYDLAGNSRSLTFELIVDTTPPVVNFVNGSQGQIKKWSNIIKWEIIELVGIVQVNLTIDGNIYSVSTDTDYFTKEVAEGDHVILIEVTDRAGFISTSTMEFTIDETAPRIEIDAAGPLVSDKEATIGWIVDENVEDLTWRVYLDDQELSVKIDLGKGSHTFREMNPGNHSVRMVVSDEAGNQKEILWDFIIEDDSRTASGSESGGGIIWFAVIMIIIFIFTVGMIIIFRRKKKDVREEKKVPDVIKKPDKISLGGMPIRSVHGHQSPSHSINAPPMARSQVKGSDSHVEHRKDDGSYYRPSTKKTEEKSKRVLDAPPPQREVVKAGSTEAVSAVKDPRKPVFTPPAPEKERPQEWGDIEDWEGEELEEWSEMEEI